MSASFLAQVHKIGLIKVSSLTQWPPWFSEFFLFARSLACPRSPSSPSSLVLWANTAVLLLATQEKISRVAKCTYLRWESRTQQLRPWTRSQSLESWETQDPTVMPVARSKKRARNLDPVLRSWLRGQVTRKTKMGTTGLRCSVVSNHYA